MTDKITKFKLKDKDVSELATKLRSGELGSRSYRGLILLLKHYDHTNKDIAKLLDITQKTVVNICQSYSEFGLKNTLKDRKRPGRPVLFDKSITEAIINLVKGDPPKDHSRWTLALINNSLVNAGLVKTISKEKIRIILKENGLVIRTKS